MRFQNDFNIPYDRKRVIDWYHRSGAFARLAPSFNRVTVQGLAPAISEGMINSFRLRAGLLNFDWKAIHHVDGERNFTDEMLKGPFAEWRHLHQFISEGPSTRLHDDVKWESPVSRVFSTILKGQVDRSLTRYFHFRNRRLQHDLRRHEKFQNLPRLKIGITGATGLIGSALSAFLSTGGHEVFHFVRHTPKHEREIYWNLNEQKIDARKVEPLDVVVHLAGENIGGKRWSTEFKKLVLESRTRGTELIARTLATLKGKPRRLLSASAIGIYTGGFLGEVCRAWEKAAEPALHQENLKVTIARLGVVLTSKGGALKELTLPTLLGLGAKIGPGTQLISWISHDDVIAALHELILNPHANAPYYDLVSPRPIEQRELSKTLAKVLRRPHWLTIPAPVIKAVFGQMGEEVLLSSNAVEPTLLRTLNFDFEFKSLEDLLRFELGRELS
jgi:hypothetical protein